MAEVVLAPTACPFISRTAFTFRPLGVRVLPRRARGVGSGLALTHDIMEKMRVGAPAALAEPARNGALRAGRPGLRRLRWFRGATRALCPIRDGPAADARGASGADGCRGPLVLDRDAARFALPEVVGLLREGRRRATSRELVSLSGADPLNLAGIVTLGGTVPRGSGRGLYLDGVPIASQSGREIHMSEDLDRAAVWEARKALCGKALGPPSSRWPQTGYHHAVGLAARVMRMSATPTLRPARDRLAPLPTGRSTLHHSLSPQKAGEDGRLSTGLGAFGDLACARPGGRTGRGSHPALRRAARPAHARGRGRDTPMGARGRLLARRRNPPRGPRPKGARLSVTQELLHPPETRPPRPKQQDLLQRSIEFPILCAGRATPERRTTRRDSFITRR